eukprot:TRINITY_DN270_c0_g1_i1.p1 TRINITY_DN270_c0_g1~~TRINITY_DN270_c0_g1_i1.p1  ORF type:complete len:457 (+),score=131.60 TRINITY_DN270_c0_g1_i1:58-1428(+)
MRAFGAPLLLLLLLQATGGVGQRTDFEKITCPVVGSFVKNGLLVPDAAGLITKEQTLAAFLAHGVAPEIAAATTNGNFNGPDCPACPTHIDPFAMNTIADGEQVSSPFNAPQEHFRSTGIRDRSGGPFEGIFALGEGMCLGSAEAWTLADVTCFADVWDREQLFGCPDSGSGKGLATTNDVSEEKRPAGCGPCDSFLSKPEACRSALTDTIEFMFEAFKNPATGTFARDEFKAMWIDLEFPTGFDVTTRTSSVSVPVPTDVTTRTSSVSVPVPTDDTIRTSSVSVPVPTDDTSRTSSVSVPVPTDDTSTTSSVSVSTGPLLEDDFETAELDQWSTFGSVGLAPRGKASAFSMKLEGSASATAGPLAAGAGRDLQLTFDWKTRNVAPSAKGGFSVTLRTTTGDVLFSRLLGGSERWTPAQFVLSLPSPASDLVLGFALDAVLVKQKALIDNVVVELL